MSVSRLQGMAGIGVDRGCHFIRFVFSNEPAGRLAGIRHRIAAAL